MWQNGQLSRNLLILLTPHNPYADAKKTSNLLNKLLSTIVRSNLWRGPLQATSSTRRHGSYHGVHCHHPPLAQATKGSSGDVMVALVEMMTACVCESQQHQHFQEHINRWLDPTASSNWLLSIKRYTSESRPSHPPFQSQPSFFHWMKVTAKLHCPMYFNLWDI